jgi:NAD(P)-dependent dehydrogenase (short-subunit alcohol dehydrogenase family)
MFLLDGKTALITGAGSGNGEAIARLFGAQGARAIIANLAANAALRVAGDLIVQNYAAEAQTLDVVEASCRGDALP